ncbi:MAG: response regulator transcription factor [Terriglobales bacterium]
MSKRILVVDDHDVVRQGVRLILRNQPDCEIVAEADNGEDAIEKILSLKPDLVILDIGMPGKDGLAVLREVAAPDFPHRPKVLILSMHESNDLGAKIKSSGGHGYVVKTRAARDLNRAISTIFEGGTYFEDVKAEPVAR